jgi:hypothetical protein
MGFFKKSPQKLNLETLMGFFKKSPQKLNLETLMGFLNRKLTNVRFARF